MKIQPAALTLGLPFVLIWAASAQEPRQQSASADDLSKVQLRVPTGAPLRVYLTKRLPKSLGAPVEAKLLEPVFAFDREVIPVGTLVLGSVSRTQPVPKRRRMMAILDGDFTPLRQAQVEFTTLKLPDGREITIHTLAMNGLNSIYIEPSVKTRKNAKTRPQNPNGGILGSAKQTAKDQINGAINSRSRGIADIVRGPNKREKLIDLLWSKAPYHPQYWRRGTRFDAPVRDPLDFGFTPVKAGDLQALGTQPSPDSVAHVRLLTALNSATTKQGQEVEALVTTPLFSPEHKLVLPEGTKLTGEVVLAKQARRFHRPGQLRFNFQRVDLPETVANLRTAPTAQIAMNTQASLLAAEANGNAPVQVDSEGGVHAKETKTRFIAPAISLLIASRAADNDAGRHHQAAGAGEEGNISGRTLGGGLGFGMLGAAIAQSSPYVGMAFGYYGLAWSVYSSVVGRGGDVQFEQNATMDVKFGARTPGSHFLAASGGQ